MVFAVCKRCGSQDHCGGSPERRLACLRKSVVSGMRVGWQSGHGPAKYAKLNPHHRIGAPNSQVGGASFRGQTSYMSGLITPRRVEKE